jgi:hypothetical protein
MSDTKVPAILQAIANIQEGVGTIPKNGIGPSSQGSYKFVSNDDILAAVSKLLVANKVVVRSKVLKHELVTREIGANRSVALTVVELETVFVSVEDGSEFMVVTSAEGADNGDKGARKAYTQASKIANLLTFSIATGEPDPDALDAPSNSSAPSQAGGKIATAKGRTAADAYNEVKVFLGANSLSGSVANALGSRLSGGQEAKAWSVDLPVLELILKALKAGEVE